MICKEMAILQQLGETKDDLTQLQTHPLTYDKTNKAPRVNHKQMSGKSSGKMIDDTGTEAQGDKVICICSYSI